MISFRRQEEVCNVYCSSSSNPRCFKEARVHTRGGRASAQAPRKRLPAWPLLTLFYGFPAFWALGLLQIVPLVLSVTMVIYLTIRGGVRVPRSLWIWAAFIFWVIVCTVSLEDVTDYIAWTLRFVNILNAGVYALYYFNAKESISINQLLGSLTALWVTVVVLGWGGVLFPEVRVQTPMSYVVPQSFMSNSLVKDYMLPPFAEVQTLGRTRTLRAPRRSFPLR